jgi:hypothetical protein
MKKKIKYKLVIKLIVGGPALNGGVGMAAKLDMSLLGSSL